MKGVTVAGDGRLSVTIIVSEGLGVSGFSLGGAGSACAKTATTDVIVASEITWFRRRPGSEVGIIIPSMENIKHQEAVIYII
jgi:hypothetical protein